MLLERIIKNYIYFGMLVKTIIKNCFQSKMIQYSHGNACIFIPVCYLRELIKIIFMCKWCNTLMEMHIILFRYDLRQLLRIIFMRKWFNTQGNANNFIHVCYLSKLLKIIFMRKYFNTFMEMHLFLFIYVTWDNY